MRNVRRMKFGFLFALILCDWVVQALWSSVNLRIEFVSLMSFMGLVLSMRNDVLHEFLFRFLFVIVLMNFFHIEAFPLYVLSYGIALALVRVWYRHIGSTYIEWMVMIGLALSVKEFVLYIGLLLFHNHIGSFTFFMAQRGVWVVLGNVLLFRVVMSLWHAFNGFLLKHTRRHYQ